MILQKKTLEALRDLINEKTQYRKGPELVRFFNDFGFNDAYGQGFPSRWQYTDEKLAKINGTPDLDKCIRQTFNPINFINRLEELDKHIAEFNGYLAFDKWQVKRNGAEITFERKDKVEIKETSRAPINENDFLNIEFKDVSIDKLGLDGPITETIRGRLDEIRLCLTAKAPLSVIFLCGSTLEGILLGIALKHPKEFNQAASAPKDKNGKIKAFPDWTLSNFIDVAHEGGFLREDVKKFSHSLRDFRNYIHPYQQVSSQFNPDIHTAKISWQVLKAGIYQLSNTNK